MSIFQYCLSYLFPLIALWALDSGGAFLSIIPIITFVLIPIVEIVLTPSRDNLDQKLVDLKSNNIWYDIILYALLPLQIGLILMMSYNLQQGFYQGFEILGAIATVGICCGAFGINVGHELGHRNKTLPQFVAKGLLLTSLYMHFFIEHNRGHHLRVATAEDPATSRFGESVYPFWIKSIGKSYLSAWDLEQKRLKRKKLSVFGWRNEMIQFHVIQFSALLAIWVSFGWQAMLAFIAAAFIGILLLETINYIEHYGLQRNLRDNGKYERVRPCHSWNSNHRIGRVLLFELTRHSDHHAYASRKYCTLRHFDDSPQLPYGYPAMIMIALFPPLWFAIMNPHVTRELNRLNRQAS